MYRKTIKSTKRWKQSSAIKQLLETLFLAIKMRTDFPTDVIWIKNTTVDVIWICNTAVFSKYSQEKTTICEN